MTTRFRTEKDSMGSIDVPEDALWRAQTERARRNFSLSKLRFPTRFIHSLAQIKAAAAAANGELDLLNTEQVTAIRTAADAIIAESSTEQFPLDIFQTGSGTSTNMNMNEVIAESIQRNNGPTVHPNDHVNCSQSSNDVIPTCIQVSCVLALTEQWLPAIVHLQKTIEDKARELENVVKTGRTHLMDAMPITMAQELRAWGTQLHHCQSNVNEVIERLRALPQGGTAVGSGINAPAAFRSLFCQQLSARVGQNFRPAENAFAGIAGQELSLQLAGALNSCGAVLMKISNDLRWMNSGPLAGLGEIELRALQPGSSIMPGKVNPVIPEAVAMVAAHIAGSYQTIAVAAQQGNFQLNVMLPVIAHHLLESIEISSEAMTSLADQAIADFQVKHQRLEHALARNPILVTALNSVIGYNQAAAIAKRAYQEQRPIIEVADEMTELSRSELEQLLDPEQLTHGGIPGTAD
ncbi:Fumarate hydratase class II [Pseudidiomarina piscicola]|uniref:fumarate hydratase n=1 Tax=Pseudidiomarina piscicola TaxID=2614830 RepID=A0A6S6WJ85_9GAMM|nr:class II fumarate hydratase [Pseudidiomarina piscicola]CAB0149627.1 Fumarate hydratase class II [Pseudidiomarina piscicola]VZT39075.1 Fumarate hydratase class II [Pseudomonas aeruginosa]